MGLIIDFVEWIVSSVLEWLDRRGGAAFLGLLYVFWFVVSWPFRALQQLINWLVGPSGLTSLEVQWPAAFFWKGIHSFLLGERLDYLGIIGRDPLGSAFADLTWFEWLAVLLLTAPLARTFLACTLVYLFVSLARQLFSPSLHLARRPAHPWGFILISTLLVAAVHPFQSLLVVMLGASLLAYCYAHFAASSHVRALLLTVVLNAGFNLPDWIRLAFPQ